MGLVLFGIGQQLYLQGYLPVALLVWRCQTHSYLEMGPRLVVKESPSAEASTCEASFFEVCAEPFNRNQLGDFHYVGLSFAFVIFATSTCFIGWVVRNRGSHIVKASQPLFLIFICARAFILAATIAPLSLDDGALGKDGGCVDCECRGCDIACMSAPWLYTLVRVGIHEVVPLRGVPCLN